MTLQQRIYTDLINALKQRDSKTVSVLRLIKASIINVGKQGKPVTDNDVVLVLKRELKQRRESQEQFTNANRQTLANEQSQAIEIVKKYLPVELSTQQLDALVDEIIGALPKGDKSIKNMGEIMSQIAVKSQGRADNVAAARRVKEKLAEKPGQNIKL